MNTTIRHSIMRGWNKADQGRLGCSSLLLAMFLLWPGRVRAADIGQTFATPQAAVQALGSAASSKDRAALRALFGLDTDELVAPDLVQATNELERFTAAFDETNRIARLTPTRCILEVGWDAWPFPIPLVEKEGRWYFDTEAGKEEILNRRIGRNELKALQTVRAYVDAQREYASRDRDDDEVLEYAQRIISSPGSMNGLYWSPRAFGETSPLGPLVAEADAEGYAFASRSSASPSQPFHGYFFKVLRAQGRHAPGGKYDYVINGNMIGGFALVAWPAQHGESGVMTFIVNQQGRVYQKNLGPKTARIAKAMKRYDPDESWGVSPD